MLFQHIPGFLINVPIPQIMQPDSNSLREAGVINSLSNTHEKRTGQHDSKYKSFLNSRKTNRIRDITGSCELLHLTVNLFIHIAAQSSA